MAYIGEVSGLQRRVEAAEERAPHNVSNLRGATSHAASCSATAGHNLSHVSPTENMSEWFAAFS